MTSVAKRQAPPGLEQSLRQAASLAGVPGLPADAVLCIRHLTARLDTHALRHAGSLLGTAGKISQQLQILAGEARRPAREIVPESATAVLFDDPFQMLACAARDWLDGQFANRWWWRSLIDGGALAQGVIPLWRLHVIHIPAALVELNTRAEEFCRRIAVTDARALVTRLSGTFALPAHSATRMKWAQLLPELAHDDPRRQLLELGFSLTRATVRLRRDLSTSLPASSGVPSAAPNAAGPKAHRRTPLRAEEVSGGEQASKRESETHTDATGSEQTRSAIVIPGQQEPIRPTGMPSPQQPEDTPQPTALDVAPTPSTCADDWRKNPSSPEPRTETKSETPDRNAQVFSQTSVAAHSIVPPIPPFARPAEWIETRYGGVLYLLNVAIHLGFYPDFMQPRDAGLALSPWAFLALAAERLAGRRLRRDALWTLLAALDGSDADHPVFDRESSPPASLPPPLQPYLRAQERDAPTFADSWPAWIDQLMPALRRRLAAALGVPPRQAGRLLCCQSARIWFSTGRLDAHFNLNEHPIAIRLSGLDRDPGWMPSAGCDIRFFYDVTIDG